MRSLSRFTGSDRFQATILLLPGFFFLFVLSLYPLGYSLFLSFSSWDVSNPDSVITLQGITNFVTVLKDPQFGSSLWLTIRFMLLALLVEIPGGLAIALMLVNRRLDRTAINLFRAVLVLTVAMVPTVSGVLWRTLMTERYGPLNYVLTLLGLPDIGWLSDTTLAFYSVVIVEVWQYTSVIILIFVAGLLGIPEEQIESAQLDGCNYLQVLWHVILPYLRPIFVIVLLLRIMDLLKRFDYIYALTQGGPGYATEVVNLYIYRLGIRFFEFPQAAAASWMVLLVMLPLTLYLITKVFLPREE